MAFKRSAVRSRLSPPTTDRKANALRSCSIYGSDTPLPCLPQQLNQVHTWRPFSIRRWALFYFINDGGNQIWYNKAIAVGSSNITLADLASPELVTDEAFQLIINALLMAKYGDVVLNLENGAMKEDN